ncbi:MAG: hypothetical protein R2862_09575 [Thermoanaerobaculia bacterium]
MHRAFLALHSRYEDPKSRAFWRRWRARRSPIERDGSTVFIVDKLNRKLHVYIGGRRVDSVTAELGSKGLKRKLHAGDQATPEGRYRHHRDARLRPHQLLQGADARLPQRGRSRPLRPRPPHRRGPGARRDRQPDRDPRRGRPGARLADGCMALRNRDMDRIFARASGTPVTIIGTF